MQGLTWLSSPAFLSGSRPRSSGVDLQDRQSVAVSANEGMAEASYLGIKQLLRACRTTDIHPLIFALECPVTRLVALLAYLVAISPWLRARSGPSAFPHGQQKRPESLYRRLAHSARETQSTPRMSTHTLFSFRDWRKCQ
eukprot:3853390-Pyramimonas_sp.AAC.1